MKKSTKRTLISSSIMIAVGIALILAGLVKGGLNSLKENFGNYGSLWTKTADDKDYDISSDKASYHKEFDADSVDKISCSINAAEVTVVQDEDTDKIIFATEKMNNSKVLQKGDELYLTAEKKGKTDKPGQVYIVVPKDKDFEWFELKLAAGTVDIERVESDKFKLDVSAGDVTIKSVEAEDAEIYMAAGSVAMHDSKIEEMNAEVAMGSLAYEGLIEKDCSLEVGMGEVEMKLEDSYDDHSYEVETGLGAVTIGKHDYAGVVSVEDDNDTKSKFDIECGMGAIDIQFKK